MNVVVGMNTNGSCTSRTLISLTRMFNADPEFQSRLILVEGGCADFAGGRNRLVREFLSTGVDWLLVVDSDMVFTAEDWETLRDSADPTERPFVTGTYFVDNDPPRPCCVVFDQDYNAHSPTLTDGMDELLRVHASGIGFGLIHRDVFLKAGDMTSDHEWFEHGWRTPKGETMPEDYAFASRCGGAGIPIYLNTKVRVGHLKPRVLDWTEYQQSLSGDRIPARKV